VTPAAFVHDSDPPETMGMVGALRSIRAVSAAAGVPGAHAETLPAPSTLRNSTSVSPWAVTSSQAPDDGDVHVWPPSADVRYS
jgi:hypothetical protein